MAKYKVVKEFVLNGILQKLNTEIELDFKMANLKSIQGNIQKVLVGAPSASPSQEAKKEEKPKVESTPAQTPPVVSSQPTQPTQVPPVSPPPPNAPVKAPDPITPTIPPTV